MGMGPGNPPPQVAMMQMVNGLVVSRCIALAADLGIADLLKDGARDAAGLAAGCGADPDTLYRVLRTLSGVGVFTELPGRQFHNSPLSEVLRSDAPGSIRHLARWLGHPLHWGVIGDLDYSVRTGNPVVHKDQPGKNPFAVLAENPDALRVFNEAMNGMSQADGAAILQAYDFSPFARIVDVGGGHGSLAIQVARAVPAARLVVFDLPPVAEGARQQLAGAGLDGRVEAVGGSFLERVPGPADLCVLKHILHLVGDPVAGRILANCRAALNDGGRVLVCEMMIAPGPEGVPARIMDMEMLTGTGGRERTEEEFAALFAASGLRLERVIRTPLPLRLLEATAA